jgi:hypothetical protein
MFIASWLVLENYSVQKLLYKPTLGSKVLFGKELIILKMRTVKKIKFNSMIDAMNFMGTQGWEFVQAYVMTDNNQNVRHWLLKKEISQQQTKELEEGFKEE